MIPEYLTDGPADSPLTLALAHGAGAPMDSPFMNTVAEGVAERGWRVARFEFPYMAARRDTGKKKPPDRAPVLLKAWPTAIGDLGAGSLVIGGKSMGGRMAGTIADETGVRGLVCLGYPFHPPGKPEKLRTEHLEALKTPTLILQGERDPFGRPDEIPGYSLSDAITVDWLPDGDHGFKPRRASGHTEEGNLTSAIEKIAGFLEKVSVSS